MVEDFLNKRGGSVLFICKQSQYIKRGFRAPEYMKTLVFFFRTFQDILLRKKTDYRKYDVSYSILCLCSMEIP